MASTEVGGPLTRARAQIERGLPTPEPTPGPEDLERSTEKRSVPDTSGSQSLAPIAEGSAQESRSVSYPNLGATGNDAESTSSDDSSDGQLDTNSQRRGALEYVLSCKKSEYRKILGLQEEDNDARADKENILNRFRKQGCLLHPKYNKDPKAKEAFKRIIRAAKELQLSTDDINEVKSWDGVEELPLLHLTGTGHWTVSTDSMEGVEKSDELRPLPFHHDIWRQATPLLGQLVSDPRSEQVIAHIEQLNRKIEEENRKAGFDNDTAFTVDVGSFSAIFASATPYLERLRKSHADEEAKRYFETLNAQLTNFNKHHQYPSEWVMNMPVEETANGTQVETSIDAANATSNPGYRRCKSKAGYILDNGVQKKIEGAMKAGYGYQLLLSHPGQNGLTINELVAASAGGKGFGRSYTARPDAVVIKPGALEDLTGKQLSDMVISGVAAVRRHNENVPARGWMREPKTICSVGFGETPTKFVWYARSVLGRQFGQKVIDEEINDFCTEAGQDTPLTLNTSGKSPGGSNVIKQPSEDETIPETRSHRTDATGSGATKDDLLMELRRLQERLVQLESR